MKRIGFGFVSVAVVAVCLLAFENCGGPFLSLKFSSNSINSMAYPPRTVGSAQVMFEMTASAACSTTEYVDSPVRAWWDASNTLHMVSPSVVAYAFTGSSLDTVQHDCASPLSNSLLNPDYNATDDSQWLEGIYTSDGTNVYAIVHNEWHLGCTAANQSGSWVNSITLMESTNGGATFSQPSDYQIRIPPTAWSDSFCTPAGQTFPQFGSFQPTNIIRKSDGYYYAMFFSLAAPNGAGSNGNCIMRTPDLSSASAWTVWTANGWAIASTTPACQDVAGFPGAEIESINFSTYLNQYIAVFGTAVGVSYETSDDMLTWSPPAPLPVSMNTANGNLVYPSLLSMSNDPSVTGRNYENIGQDAYLYYVAINPADPADQHRYIVRQQIHFGP